MKGTTEITMTLIVLEDELGITYLLRKLYYYMLVWSSMSVGGGNKRTHHKLQL